jgi:hypothetical protein
MDNLDRRMVEVHVGKISAARGICATLYEGFEKHPIAEEEVEVEEVDSVSVDVDEDPTEMVVAV